MEIELCDKISCTGCMACVNACRTDAIVVIEDEEGFLRPQIDEEKCIRCKKCQRVCPELTVPQHFCEDKAVYACWLKNKKLRRQSTSGGAFTALAEAVLCNNGKVFGVGFSEHKKIIHKEVENESELKELRGSKYVQSDIGLIFRSVKKYLDVGDKVLFSGTPCQVAGLYSFLGKRYEKQLWTMDIVCHGVPSPMVYHDYIEMMEKKYNSPVSYVYFRDKRPGWWVFGMKIVFENSKVYRKNTYEDPYIRAFLRNLCLRPSCYHCKYANINRVSDITVSDFWGYKETCFQNRDNDKGISMVMLNTDNGRILFEEARQRLKVWEKEQEEAVAGNQALRRPFSIPEKREEFWKDYKKLSFEEMVVKYMYPENPVPEWVITQKKVMRDRHKPMFIEYVKDSMIHAPNIITMKLLGQKNYERLKSKLKR